MKSINNRFYFDYNATSPVEDSVLKHLQTGDFPFSNPASLHTSGKESRKSITETSLFLLNTFDVKKTHEVVYHSGATEGINAYFKGQAYRGFREKKLYHFFFSTVDHAAVVELKNFLEELGHHVHFFGVDQNGDVDELSLVEKLKTVSASGGEIFLNWTWVNNETGVVWELEKIAKLKREFSLHVHVDAVQSIGKIANWRELDSSLDAYTYSAHKFGALKGIGFTLFLKNEIFESFIHGGSQQNEKRAGTENTLGVLSIRWALDKYLVNFNYQETMSAKKFLEDEFLKFSDSKKSNSLSIIGLQAKLRNTNTIFLHIKNVKAEVIQTAFDINGIELSTGSACSSGVIKENRVLMNMGHSKEDSRSAIRFSFSPFMTINEAKTYIEKILKVIEKFV